MCDKKYNGWTNWETWSVNIHFDNFDETADMLVGDLDLTDEEDITKARIALANIISQDANDYCLGHMKESNGSSLAHSFIYASLHSVNYREIADHYIDDAVQYLGG